MRALPPVARAVVLGARTRTSTSRSRSARGRTSDGLGRLMRRAGWRDVAYRNLSGGIVALHRATRP